MKRNIIAVASSKGGVGKSTTSMNLAIDCANSGLSVLLVDAEQDGTTMDCQQIDNENLTVINGYERSFPKMLVKYKQMYDLIIIDTAGVNTDLNLDSSENLQSLINQQVFNSADMLLIPIEPSAEATRKTIRFASSVNGYIEASRGALSALAFINMVDTRETMSKDALSLFENNDILPMSKGFVRKSTLIKQASAEFKSVNEYQKTSPIARDFTELRIEIIEHLNNK